MKSKCFFCQGFPLKFYYIAIIITDMLGFRMEKYKNTRRIWSCKWIMISRFIAPTYALEYQKNHCSPFSVRPWELSLHDGNNHFGNCPRPSPTSLYAYRSQMSSHGWQPEIFSLESYAVGIIGILIHDPIHVGSRLLGTGDSFGEVSRSLGWPRQWLYLPSPHCPLK